MVKVLWTGLTGLDMSLEVSHHATGHETPVKRAARFASLLGESVPSVPPPRQKVGAAVVHVRGIPTRRRHDGYHEGICTGRRWTVVAVVAVVAAVVAAVATAAAAVVLSTHVSVSTAFAGGNRGTFQ